MRIQKGFSLVELMIAMVLGLLIVGMVLAAYLTGTTTSRSINQTTALTENGRFAVQQISDDIQMAGYYGRTDFRNKDDSTSVCSINATDLRTALNLPVKGYNNFDATAWTAISSCFYGTEKPKSGTDVLIIRRAGTKPATGTLDTTQYYMQASPTALKVGDGSETFSISDNLGTAHVRPYVLHIYYLNDADDALKRLVLKPDATNNFVAETIAENIEDFQVEYGIDSAGNGSPNPSAPSVTTDDSYRTSPAAGDWKDVAAVKLYVLARSQATVPGQGPEKLFTLGKEATKAAFNDDFKRELFTATVRVNNVSMRREE